MSDFVYVLKDYIDYYEFKIVGVFTSREKAHHAMKQIGRGYKLSVAPFPLDVMNSDIGEEFNND